MEHYPINHIGYQKHLTDQVVAASRCKSCGRLSLPPRRMCPGCFSSDMEWEELSGKGKLIGYTTIFTGLPAFIKEGYSRQNPYCSGVVLLEEGVTVSGQLLGLDCLRPDQVKVGLPMRAVFLNRGSADEPLILLAFEVDDERV